MGQGSSEMPGEPDGVGEPTNTGAETLHLDAQTGARRTALKVWRRFRAVKLSHRPEGACQYYVALHILNALAERTQRAFTRVRKPPRQGSIPCALSHEARHFTVLRGTLSLTASGARTRVHVDEGGSSECRNGHVSPVRGLKFRGVSSFSRIRQHGVGD